MFEPLATPLTWPAPPAPARIEFVGDLSSDADLEPAKSFGDVLFGEPPLQTMLSPYAVCTDGGDRVFVGDSNAQVVHVFDLDTREYQRWGPGEDDALFGQPLGVAWDSRGRLLVADGAAACIYILDGRGNLVGRIGAGVLQRPSGIVVEPGTGRIFVADVAAHQVLLFDTDGTLLKRVGERGAGAGQFNFPTNVAIDRQGRLYVSDSLNFRVQVFDREQQVVDSIGSHGDRPGYFAQPKGLALDSADHLYVVDAQFESVQIFDAQGQLLLTFGHEGRDPGGFWLPAGIHIDANDRIWIADTYNRRVQVFQYLGETP